MMANGMLAGLVAITAPCAFVTPGDVGGDRLHRRRARDRGGVLRRAQAEGRRSRSAPSPCTASTARSACSCVGLFANGSYGAGWNGSDVEGVKGLFWGDAGQLGAQLLGVVVIWTVIFGVAFAFFKIQDAVSKAMGKGGIRSKEDDELAGLDVPEMGVAGLPRVRRAPDS